jgi:hypothetical protein
MRSSLLERLRLFRGRASSATKGTGSSAIWFKMKPYVWGRGKASEDPYYSKSWKFEKIFIVERLFRKVMSAQIPENIQAVIAIVNLVVTVSLMVYLIAKMIKMFKRLAERAVLTV